MSLKLNSAVFAVGDMPILGSLTELETWITPVRYTEPLLENAVKLQKITCHHAEVSATNFIQWLGRPRLQQPNPIREVNVVVGKLSEDDEQFIREYNFDQLILDHVSDVTLQFVAGDYSRFISPFMPLLSNASVISLYSYRFVPAELELVVHSFLSARTSPDSVQTLRLYYFADSYRRGVIASVTADMSKVVVDEDGDWMCSDLNVIKSAIGDAVVEVLSDLRMHAEKVVYSHGVMTLFMKSAHCPEKLFKIII